MTLTNAKLLPGKANKAVPSEIKPMDLRSPFENKHKEGNTNVHETRFRKFRSQYEGSEIVKSNAEEFFAEIN